MSNRYTDNDELEDDGDDKYDNDGHDAYSLEHAQQRSPSPVMAELP